MRRWTLFILSVILLSTYLPATAQKTKVEVKGKAVDSLTHLPVKNLQIVNKATRDRYFGDSIGQFRVVVSKLDSLFIVAPGYDPKTISLRDSITHPSYHLLIPMSLIAIELPNINVQSNRDFEQIQQDAQRLGYNEKDYELHGYQVLQSPITAIYQQTSRRERDKREYAKVMNESRKHALLKEILVKYKDLGLINVAGSEMDFFIDYCNVPEEVLKNYTEYDIVLFMRRCVVDFQNRKK